MKLTAASKEGGGWRAASIEEIPELHTEGKTLEEARESLREALEMAPEANRELAEQENEATTREEMALA
jgi:predicted RNase H-like HicB family nuclease